jgi:segregation and condensation protein B
MTVRTGMMARKNIKVKKDARATASAAKAVSAKSKARATKPAGKGAAAKVVDLDDEPLTAKRPKPPRGATSSPGKTKAPTSAGKAKAAATTSSGKTKGATAKTKAAKTTSSGKTKAATTSAGKAKAATKAKSGASATAPKAKPASHTNGKAQHIPKTAASTATSQAPKRKARGAAHEESEVANDVEVVFERDFLVDADEAGSSRPEHKADAELEDATDEDLDDASEDEGDDAASRTDPLVSDISEIRGPREGDAEESEDLELGDSDTQPVPTTRSHLKRVVESLIFVADQAVTANQLARLVKAKAAEVRDVVLEIIRDYEGRGIELVEVGGGFQFRSAAASAPFVRDLVAHRPVRLTRAQLETMALIAYRQPITRPEIDDVRGVDSGSAIKVLLDRDLVKILGRKDEAGRPLLYGTAPQFLEFFGMKSLQDLPTLREFTELSEENRELFARKMGEIPDLSDPSIDPVVIHSPDEEYDKPVADAEAEAAPHAEPSEDDDSPQAKSEIDAEQIPSADAEVEDRSDRDDDDEDDEDVADDESDDEDSEDEESDESEDESEDDDEGEEPSAASDAEPRDEADADESDEDDEDADDDEDEPASDEDESDDADDDDEESDDDEDDEDDELRARSTSDDDEDSVDAKLSASGESDDDDEDDEDSEDDEDAEDSDEDASEDDETDDDEGDEDPDDDSDPEAAKPA